MDEKISIEKMKYFCVKNVDNLTVENRQAILVYVMQSGYGTKAFDASDGVRIPLNKLPDNIITGIYSIIRGKLEQSDG
jgi:hypothetical protein